MDTLVYAGSLTVVKCWCGIRHAIPEELYAEAKFNGMETYCPLGHSGVYTDSERDQLRRQNASLKASNTHLSDQLAAAERTRIALKGHMTRLRNRITNGVCPWCTRHFSDVQRHVTTKHPDRVEKMREAMA